jgi:hypothetical protein
MNEAIQLLENQGDPLSTALALKYTTLHGLAIACVTLLLEIGSRHVLAQIFVCHL